MNQTSQQIGFCTECGILVTKTNLGAASPKVKCMNCLRRECTALETQKAAKRTSIRNAFWWRVIPGGIAALALIIGITINGIASKTPAVIPGAVIFGYTLFSFIYCVFNYSIVNDVVVWMCTRSVQWPGLIFTWDLNGFLWLIGMKLLFAVLGFLFGVIMAVLGIVLGVCIAPFAFPYYFVRGIREYRTGEETP